ncbi:hypothetical protein QQS21_000599 [Conoideocrella luteorostrata]|uniref:Carrier domain-containing protein n=1 Tax=Conoideocrella luteorostrata TaxID=1105319 RepID=A0AAJ0D0X2_9HYPO|nr:hypothetical protein QQS21_000599 [Conoideocrella luteorostrata]
MDAEISSSKPSRRHVVGEVCDIGTTKSPPKDRCLSLITLAWSLILSSQQDSKDVDFDLSMAEVALTPHRLSLSLDQNKPCLDYMKELTTNIPALPVTALGPIDVAAWRGQPAEHWATRTVVAISTTHVNYSELATKGYSLIINCFLDLNQQEIHLSADFDEHVLSRDFVRLLLGDLEHTIWQLSNIQSPRVLLSDIEIIGSSTRRAMVYLNRPNQPKLDCLTHDLIAAHASSHPDSPAVHAWDGIYSYSELDKLSSGLAEHLLRLGIEPESVVPILFEKSKLSIVTMLGVMKAGGAILPLDPGLPLERLRGLVGDVNAPLAISSAKNQGQLAPVVKELVIDDRSLARLLNGTGDSSLIPRSKLVVPDNTLYIMFTSGSTGKPKGVVVSHAAFCSSSAGFRASTHLSSPQRRTLHYASPGFDASILETLVTLTVGGCICIPSDTDRLDDLAKCIRDLDVNWALLTPSVARLLCPSDVPRLQVLCLGGEALSKDLVETWADKVILVNAYGPTEGSIIAVVSEPLSPGIKNIPLGKARNCAVWIVAPDGSKVQPFNTIGEIIIEGPGVAGGYLGDEKKTAAVFGDDAGFLKPITGSSSRYYRTGDLGRMSPDGTIEYFGRKDSQVKINGQRIELGEIEHHFKECLGDSSAPKAYDVVVEPLTAPNGNKTVLAAFVGPAIESSSARRIAQNIVLESDSPLGKDILAAARSVGAKLAQKLPVHMMPKIMLPCRVIPRTSSGKSDRKRLRAEGNALLLRDILSVQQETECSSSDSDQMRESDRPLCETTDEYQSVALTPSTDCDQFIVEQISKQQDSSSLAVPDEDSESDGNFLRRVWAEVLTISETLVSSDADFFKLGGDSIGFIKIVAAYRRAGIPITVAAISKYPTFKRMLQVCQARKSVSDSNPVGNSTKFSLIEPDTADDLCREAAEHLQTKAEDIEDLFPCTNMQEELLVANMMHPGSSVGRFVFKLNCNIDVERLKQAWQTVWSNSPTLKTKVVYTASRGPLQAVVRSPLPWHTASSLSNYIAMDENDLMGPGTPLTRLAIINEEDAIYLVWTMHHMLYDGWSIPLICKKVNALYRGDMVEHRGDFRTFVAYSKSLGSDKQMAYWANVLRDVATSTFPVSDSCKTTCLARSSWKDSLDVTGTAEACSALGVTLPTIIQAAWAIMISDFSDTTDVLFGTTVSGRNAPVENIDCIDGPTLATVPIRLTVTSNTRISDFLESVREFFAELIPYEQSGLQAIRAINSDTARACDFQNLLLIQSEPGWESNTGALGEPSHHGEPLALPLLCQVWIRQDCIEFDVAFDDKVTNLEVIQRSITQVKFIMSQLFSLSDRPAAQLSEIAHAPEVKNTSSTGKIASRTDIEPGPTTIHELITAVAKTHGKQLALCSSAVSLTFDELEQLSLNLAAHLVSLSIGRGSIVPLYFEKSVWTVVSMLATLRAGAAFILLDPTQPVEKLRAISSQINATILLTSSSLHGSVGFGASLKQIIVSSSTTAALPDASLSQLPSVSPHDLAYLIFTSGSTGQPKGVMISHSSMAFSAAAYGNALELKSHTRVLQFSSYSFDASINETLVVLILSATVCIASETERMQDLAGFIRRSEVEWAILTPSVARLLSPDDVPSLMTLDLGGEAPDKTLLSRWHRAGVRVFNVYGPAEGSGTVLCQRYRDELDPRTIGLPMGCNAWIVDRDDHDKLVLEGETGELLIEGPILADGYFEDSKKTAESFIFSPRWATAPTRMYKTGDLCFRDATQVLVYVGRKDFQVKLHGMLHVHTVTPQQ